MTSGAQISTALLMLLNALGLGTAAAQLSQQDVARLSVPRADHRIAYGPDAMQCGDLRLP